jgi:hypothetical protein
MCKAFFGDVVDFDDRHVRCIKQAWPFTAWLACLNELAQKAQQIVKVTGLRAFRKSPDDVIGWLLMSG